MLSCPVTPELWEALPLKEQQRAFLRHAKAYWETHRHRIALRNSRSIKIRSKTSVS